MSYISKRPCLPTFSAQVSGQDFKDYWSGARESTASSMSGRHFGHYKAASKNTYLTILHASFVNVASTTGLALSRWQKGLTVMLEKVAGNIKVDKLRAILLMEADFNFLNKLIFGKRLIQAVTTNHRLPRELYGGLNNRSAQEVAVNRRLSLDLFRLRRCNGAIAGVDATQCYDRIVHSLVSMLAQNEGAPLSTMRTMLSALQNMNYYLRTKFGESNCSYGGAQREPFQGTAQGNGASPAMWIMVSMYLVLLMHDVGLVTTLTSAITGLSISFLGFLFVDDTDIVVIGNNRDTPQSIRGRLQKTNTHWNGILRVTGGALKKEKCYWYLADFVWINGKCSLSYQIPEPVHITNDVGVLEEISYKLPHEATEAVGVWQDLTGSCTKQLEVLIDNIRATHSSHAKLPLPRHLCWIALKQAIWKSIDYVLPATTFTKEECLTLSKELYRPLISRLGCNRNFPLALRYNPPCLMGLGLYNPFWEQGFAKLEILLSNGHCDNITRHLIQSTIEQHQLAVGSLTPILSLPFSQYSHLTDSSWVTSVWEFLEYAKIQVKNNDLPQLLPLRENDVAIMQALHQHNTLTRMEEVSINRVRCHLEVLTLADIATGDGLRICEDYMQGVKSTTTSRYEWQKERPCNQDFKVWRKYIPSLLTSSHVLHKPLGRWTASPHKEWEWFYCPTSDRVCRKVESGWKVYRRSTEATRLHPIYITSGATISIQTSLQFTTVRTLSSTMVEFEGSVSSIRPLHQPSPDCRKVPPSLRWQTHDFWILQQSNITDWTAMSWILPGLHSHSLLAVCDGSFQPSLTITGIAAAWVIESPSSPTQLKGVCQSEAPLADPYRAELMGIYSLLSAIYFIELSCPSYTSGLLKVGCDNKAAGTKSMIDDLKVSCKHKHMDLVKANRVLI